MRLKSIKNIEKITNTMKIVASTKLGKAQRAMATSKVYNEASEKVFENSETAVPENIEKRLWVVVSSDKGLCGSIHSQLARTVRRKLLDFESGEKLIDIVAVGEKIKAQLGRSNPEQMRLSFGGTGKEAPPSRRLPTLLTRFLLSTPSTTTLRLSTTRSCPVSLLSPS